MTQSLRKRLANGLVAFSYVLTMGVFAAGPLFAATPTGQTLNQHAVMVDDSGKLVSWVANQDQAYATVARMAWEYLTRYNPGDAILEVPLCNTGKPCYYSQSQMNPNTQQPNGWPHNPAGLYSMLIESALEYYQYSGNSIDSNHDGEADFLKLAKDVADWLLGHGMTLPSDSWANVTYASGQDGSLTYHGSDNSNGSGDGPGVIEPDKLGEFGHSLVNLYKLTGDTKYLTAAISNANALVSHIRNGDVDHSPWPFRVNAATNVVPGREEYSSHVISPIELFDDLISLNQGNVANYTAARTTAWNWMMQYPMQNNRWAGYFEDMTFPDSDAQPWDNRNQLDAMMVARHLLQHPEQDPQWETHVRGLISWVETTFGLVQEGGAMTIKEQLDFWRPMGSHTSRYASINALLYEKTGDLAAKEKAYRSFNWATYMARSNGVIVDGPTVNETGGNQWFTDGYGDYIRHFMVGMGAVPAFAPNGQVHLLESSSVVKNVIYGPTPTDYVNVNSLTYQTFDNSGVEKIKVNRAPDVVTLNGVAINQRGDLNAEGWVYNAIDSTISIRRDNGASVVVSFSGTPTNLFPSTAITAPTSNATFTAPATFTVSANASDPDGVISKVEFYQNGALVSTDTIGPSYDYNAQNLAAGTYSFTTKAYDNVNASATSTAVVVTVNPPGLTGGPLTASTPATTKQTSASGTITSPTFAASPGNLAVAFLASDGSGGNSMQSFSSVTTNGLTWTLRKRTNPAASGTAEIWTAVIPNGFTSGTATATRASGTFPGLISVVVFSGVDTAATAAVGGASGNNTPSVSLTTTRAGSWVWGVGNDWSNTSARTIGSNQTMVEHLEIGSAGAFWAQRQTSPTANPGSVTLNDTAPTSGTRWNMAAIEIVPLPAGDITPPVVTVQPVSNVGVNTATINWTTNEPATSQVDYGLMPGSYPNQTTLDTTAATQHSQALNGLQPGTTYHYRVRSSDAANNTTVSGDNTFTTPQPPDTQAPSVPQNVTATALSTTQAKIEWQAASDNVAVTDYEVFRDGAHLTDTTQATNYVDSGLTPGQAYSYTVIAKDAADNASAQSDPAQVTLPLPDTEAPSVPTDLLASDVTTTSASLSWTPANDNVAVTGYEVWRDGSLVTTVPSNSYVDNNLQPSTTYTYSIKALDAAGNASEASAEVQATTETPPPDLQAPSVPGNFIGSNLTFTGITLTWDAATDNVGVTSYQILRDGVEIGTTTSATTFADNNLQPSTSYVYLLRAYDAAGNYSETTLTVTTPTPDTTAPTVALAAPVNNATVSGTVNVTANASDNVGVVGVQFLLDGSPLGAEDTAAPYQYSWNSVSVASGSHTLSARARDAAGNVTTATNVTVNVQNGIPGLVAAYNFNETSGTTLNDRTGKGHTGTITGTASWTAGKTGNALNFNGTNNWVTIADANDLDLTNALTIEAWVKPSAVTGWRTVMMKETSGAMAYGMYGANNSSKPAFYGRVSSSNIAVTGTANMSTTAWTHLTGTFDGSTMRLYVNGVQVATQALSGSFITTTGVLRIGGNSIWNEYFKGLMDDIRIYNRVLSPSEIQTDMNTAVN